MELQSVEGGVAENRGWSCRALRVELKLIGLPGAWSYKLETADQLEWHVTAS